MRRVEIDEVATSDDNISRSDDKSSIRASPKDKLPDIIHDII